MKMNIINSTQYLFHIEQLDPGARRSLLDSGDYLCIFKS